MRTISHSGLFHYRRQQRHRHQRHHHHHHHRQRYRALLSVRPIFIFLLSSLASLASLAIPSEIQAKENREQSFSNAYQMEKISPSFSVEMYEYALRQTVSAKIEKATRWRLFLLYKKFARHSLAYIQLITLREKRMAGKQLDSLFANIVRSSANDWNSSETETTEFFNLLEKDWHAKSQRPEERREVQKLWDAFFFEPSLPKELRQTFLNQWVEVIRVAKRDSSAAVRIVHRYSGFASLDVAEIYVKEGKVDLAYEEIQNSNKPAHFNLARKIKKQYLLGIIYRERGNFRTSNQHYYRALKLSLRRDRYVYYELIAYNYFLQQKFAAAIDTIDSALERPIKEIHNDAFFLHYLLEYYRYLKKKPANNSDLDAGNLLGKQNSNRKNKILNRIEKKMKSFEPYLAYRRKVKPNMIIEEAWKLSQLTSAN